MNEEKMTLKESVRLTLRAWRFYWKNTPRFVLSTVLWALADAVSPYAVVWFSARLVAELSDARDPQALAVDVAWVLGVTALLTLVRSVLLHWKRVEREQLGYEWTTVGLLWQLLGCLLGMHSDIKPPQSRQQITRMKNVLTYFRIYYGEPITLDELAAVAGMSPRYFCRAFAALTGRTPIAYLNYYRIECACERMTLTDKSVTEIAFACGFNDMSYFSRVFKQLKGTTHTAYRN